MNVSIYINVYHKGHLKYGTGLYTSVLEYITKKTGEPITKTFIHEISRTTKNRTALIACITAFGELIKECNIKLIINSEYVCQAINSDDWFIWLNTGRNAKGEPAKNLDLWQQFFDLADKHHTEFVYAEKNTYTDWMFREIKIRKIESKEDAGNV